MIFFYLIYERKFVGYSNDLVIYLSLFSLVDLSLLKNIKMEAHAYAQTNKVFYVAIFSQFYLPNVCGFMFCRINTE